MKPITVKVEDWQSNIDGTKDLIRELVKKKIVSSAQVGDEILLARYNVNKTTLKKILKNS